MKFHPILFVLFVMGSMTLTGKETEKELHQRMRWWNEGRLGMFLHWGVYSSFGGEYRGMDHGKEMGQASAEWIYLKANIPQEEYRKTALGFNPEQFNAAEWVLQFPGRL